MGKVTLTFRTAEEARDRVDYAANAANAAMDMLEEFD